MQVPSPLDARSTAQHYTSLCATATTPAISSIQLSNSQRADPYDKGLTGAASIQRQSVKDSTSKAKTAVVRELADWLQAVHAADSRTLLTVTPEDMLVYFTQHWLPNHAGSATAEGNLIAAPSSLSGLKSHLATEFETLGRLGNWDPVTMSGNPMHSKQIRDMLKGYNNQAADLGYQKKGAVPLTEAEMHLLLSSMAQQFHSTTDQAQLSLLLRDALLFSMLWQSCFRGFNAGAVGLCNIVLPTGGSALPYLIPGVTLTAGAVLHLLPDHTKNKKGGHCRVTLTCDALCLSTWLARAVQQHAEAGQPITNFITRPLQVGTNLFAEKSMSCSNVWARLTKYLKALNMYTGQSVHSTRRGKMIHQQLQMNASLEDISDAAMCNEKNAKYYTDIHRPTRFRCS